MTYPTLRPTTREFTPPPLPFSTITTMDQRVVRSLLASKPGRGTLTLSYENLTDEQALSFITSYESAKGQTNSLTLPTELVSGLGPNFDAYVLNIGSDITWRWDGPPKLDSVKKGLTTVSVTLTAYVNPGTLTRLADAPSNPYQPPSTIDTTKYPSFSGGTITPPSPPTPGQGKKWISYNSELRSGSSTSAPVYDSNGNVYIVTSNSTKLSAMKFNSSGALLWRRVVEPADLLVKTTAVTLGIYNNVLLIYTLLGPIGSINANSFVLFGISTGGTMLYARRYSFVVFPFSITLHPITGKIIMLGMSSANVQGGSTLLAFNANSGLMDQRATVTASPSEYTSGLNSVAGIYPKPNGSVVLGYSGAGRYDILVELNSSFTTVVASCSFQGLEPINLSYRPDTGGFLALSRGDCLVYLDDSLQIVERRTFTASTSGNAIGFDTRFFYISNSYYYVTASPFTSLMVASPINGRTILKYNWDTNTVEYATFVTEGTYAISPSQKRIYTTVTTSEYTWLRMAELELPITANTITTPNPPNISLTGVSQYAPSISSSNVTRSVFRYYVPFQCTPSVTSDTIPIEYDTYMEPIDMNVITDLP